MAVGEAVHGPVGCGRHRARAASGPVVPARRRPGATGVTFGRDNRLHGRPFQATADTLRASSSVPMRLALLCLLLVGCSSPPPSDAHAAVEAALRDGDGHRALGLLRQAAADGDLYAMAQLADGLERGYVSAGYDEQRGGALHVPVRVWPGEAAWRRYRFTAARDRRARAGDPDAILLVAEHLHHRAWRDGAWESPSPVHIDSAQVLLEPLAMRGHINAMVWLSTMARSDGRPGDADAWLRRAEARGSVAACTQRAWGARGRAPNVAALAAHLDQLDRCRQMPGGAWVDTEAPIANLRRAAEADAPGARALLDSLIALRR